MTFHMLEHTCCAGQLAAEEDFEDLCFEYGIELDDVVSYAKQFSCPLKSRAGTLWPSSIFAVQTYSYCRRQRRKC